MPQRPQHAGERLFVNVAVDRQPHAGRQVDIDATRSRARMRADQVPAGAVGGDSCGGGGAGVAGVRAILGSDATASVTTPYGMNCKGSLAMLAAFRWAERQL